MLKKILKNGRKLHIEARILSSILDRKLLLGKLITYEYCTSSCTFIHMKETLANLSYGSIEMRYTQYIRSIQKSAYKVSVLIRPSED